MKPPFTSEDADRLLGLADQFLEDWEETALQSDCDADYPDFQERHDEWIAIRPLLAAAPDMLDELQAGTEAAQCVLNNWTQGNLAAAVNLLEEWMTGAQLTIAKAKGGAA